MLSNVKIRLCHVKCKTLSALSREVNVNYPLATGYTLQAPVFLNIRRHPTRGAPTCKATPNLYHHLSFENVERGESHQLVFHQPCEMTTLSLWSARIRSVFSEIPETDWVNTIKMYQSNQTKLKNLVESKTLPPCKILPANGHFLGNFWIHGLPMFPSIFTQKGFRGFPPVLQGGFTSPHTLKDPTGFTPSWTAVVKSGRNDGSLRFPVNSTHQLGRLVVNIYPLFYQGLIKTSNRWRWWSPELSWSTVGDPVGLQIWSSLQKGTH